MPFTQRHLVMICHMVGYVYIKLTFSNVKVKEITVKNCLHNSSYNGNEVIMILKVVAVDPVEKVQGTIRAKSKQIM